MVTIVGPRVSNAFFSSANLQWTWNKQLCYKDRELCRVWKYSRCQLAGTEAKLIFWFEKIQIFKYICLLMSYKMGNSMHQNCKSLDYHCTTSNIKTWETCSSELTVLSKLRRECIFLSVVNPQPFPDHSFLLISSSAFWDAFPTSYILLLSETSCKSHWLIWFPQKK